MRTLCQLVMNENSFLKYVAKPADGTFSVVTIGNVAIVSPFMVYVTVPTSVPASIGAVSFSSTVTLFCTERSLPFGTSRLSPYASRTPMLSDVPFSTVMGESSSAGDE